MAWSLVGNIRGAQGLAGPSAVSTDADNVASLGSDNLIYVPSVSSGDFLSANAGNSIVLGTDNKLFFPEAPTDGRWYGRRFQAGAMNWQPVIPTSGAAQIGGLELWTASGGYTWLDGNSFSIAQSGLINITMRAFAVPHLQINHGGGGPGNATIGYASAVATAPFTIALAPNQGRTIRMLAQYLSIANTFVANNDISLSVASGHLIATRQVDSSTYNITNPISVDTDNAAVLGSDGLIYVPSGVSKTGDTMTGTLTILSPTTPKPEARSLNRLIIDIDDPRESQTILNAVAGGGTFLEVKEVHTPYVDSTNPGYMLAYKFKSGHLGPSLAIDSLNSGGNVIPSPGGARFNLDYQGSGDSGLGTGLVMWNMSTGAGYCCYSPNAWVIKDSPTSSVTGTCSNGIFSISNTGSSQGFQVTWSEPRNVHSIGMFGFYPSSNAPWVTNPAATTVWDDMIVARYWTHQRDHINLTRYSSWLYGYTGEWDANNPNYSDNGTQQSLVRYLDTLYASTNPSGSPIPTPADPPNIDTARWDVMPDQSVLGSQLFWYTGKWAKNHLYFNSRLNGISIVEGSDGNLYRSLTDNNVNANPISQPTQWKPFVDLSSCVQKTGDTMTGTLRILNPAAGPWNQLIVGSDVPGDSRIEITPGRASNWFKVTDAIVPYVDSTNPGNVHIHKWNSAWEGWIQQTHDQLDVNGNPVPARAGYTLNCQGVGNGIFSIINGLGGASSSFEPTVLRMNDGQGNRAELAVQSFPGPDLQVSLPSNNITPNWWRLACLFIDALNPNANDWSRIAFCSSPHADNRSDLLICGDTFNGSRRINLTRNPTPAYHLADGDFQAFTFQIGVERLPDRIAWHDQVLYRSITHNYSPDPPDLDPTNWEALPVPTDSYQGGRLFWYYGKWATNERYHSGRLNGIGVVEGSDGNLYRSLINDNIGHNPITNPAQWKTFVDLSNLIKKTGDTMTGHLHVRTPISATPISVEITQAEAYWGSSIRVLNTTNNSFLGLSSPGDYGPFNISDANGRSLMIGLRSDGGLNFSSGNWSGQTLLLAGSLYNYEFTPSPYAPTDRTNVLIRTTHFNIDEINITNRGGPFRLPLADDWNNTSGWNSNTLVRYQQALYVSNVPVNPGEDPPDINPTDWTLVSNQPAVAGRHLWFMGPWATNQIYYNSRLNGIGIVEGSDGNLYRSLVDNNVGNDPVTSPTAWKQL